MYMYNIVKVIPTEIEPIKLHTKHNATRVIAALNTAEQLRLTDVWKLL